MSVCVCACVRVCVCAHTRVCVCKCVYVFLYACANVSVCAFVLGFERNFFHGRRKNQPASESRREPAVDRA